jgi:hypothetical protein
MRSIILIEGAIVKPECNIENPREQTTRSQKSHKNRLCIEMHAELSDHSLPDLPYQIHNLTRRRPATIDYRQSMF